MRKSFVAHIFGFALVLLTVAPVSAKDIPHNLKPVGKPTPTQSVWKAKIPKLLVQPPAITIVVKAFGANGIKTPESDGSYQVGGDFHAEVTATTPGSAKPGLNEAKALTIGWTAKVTCLLSKKVVTTVSSPALTQAALQGKVLSATVSLASNAFMLTKCTAASNDLASMADVTFSIDAVAVNGLATHKEVLIHFFPSTQ